MNVRARFFLSAEDGFSLVELLIYIAVFAGLAVLVTMMFFSASQTQLRMESRAEVQQNIRGAVDAIQYAIHRAQEAELQGGGSILVLNGGEIRFEEREGALVMEENGEEVVLTTEKVEVENLSFEILQNSLQYGDGEIVSVRFTVRVRYRDGGNSALEHSQEFISSAQLAR